MWIQISTTEKYLKKSRVDQQNYMNGEHDNIEKYKPRQKVGYNFTL